MATKYIGAKVYILTEYARTSFGYDQEIYSLDITGFDQETKLFHCENFKRVFLSPNAELDLHIQGREFTDMPKVEYNEALVVEENWFVDAWTDVCYWCVTSTRVERSFAKITDLYQITWNLETLLFYHDHGASASEKKLIKEYEKTMFYERTPFRGKSMFCEKKCRDDTLAVYYLLVKNLQNEIKELKSKIEELEKSSSVEKMKEKF